MRLRSIAAVFAGYAFVACSRSNNVVLGRVEAAIGGRTVVVTDCYRTSVPAPVAETSAGVHTYRFTPCRDADVVIRADSLTVNGRDYGAVAMGDTVIVDHGVVHIARGVTPSR